MTRKTNKILAATAMLLVSLLMLGTASFAWFAMNTRSVADGLTVEAYSDSNFLEISQNDTDYSINTKFTEDNTGLLRLVTPKFMKDGEIVTITATPVTEGRYDGTGTYYKAVDSDKAGSKLSYSYANDELKEPSATTNMYKDMEFVVVTSDELVTNNDTYYTFSKNTYTLTDLQNQSAKGCYVAVHYEAATSYSSTATYYQKNGGKFEKVADQSTVTSANVTDYYVRGNGFPSPDNSTYDGVSYYYKKVNTTGASAYAIVSGLELGTELNGYYTVTETSVTVADATSNGTSVYYLKNVVTDAEGNTYTDYSYIGVIPSGTVLANYLYWGRAYSNDPTKVQENNTLNIINEDTDATNYYLAKTLYLRQAEGTNNASNLRIEDVRIGGAKNELSNALRILFVAYSEHDEETLVTYTYDPANDRGAESEVLFSTLLGNEAETITVEVYVYFDGTDADANNAQVAGAVLNGQTIEIEFAINELSYNQ